MSQIVFVLGCHPDDIEFVMAGTLFLLKEKGWEIHYMTLANGNCGSLTRPPEEIASIRREESRRAADMLGACYHESLAKDLEVFYCDDLLRKVTAVIREIGPDILLIPSLEDYMEDHMNTARIAVTAAFSRGISNYASIPEREAIQKDIALYHAMPYGLRDGMRRLIVPEFYVNITGVIGQKAEMLSCHKSQKQWIDDSQGVDNYLNTMTSWSEELGRMSGEFQHAEGWRRHSHVGYSSEDVDPLTRHLAGYCL